MTAKSASHVVKRPADRPSPTGEIPHPAVLKAIHRTRGPRPHEINGPRRTGSWSPIAPALVSAERNVESVSDHHPRSFHPDNGDNGGRDIARVTYKFYIEKKAPTMFPTLRTSSCPVRRRTWSEAATYKESEQLMLFAPATETRTDSANNRSSHRHLRRRDSQSIPTTQEMTLVSQGGALFD